MSPQVLQPGGSGLSEIIVTISGMVTGGSQVMVKDSFNNEFEVDSTMNSTVGLPKVGETWIIVKKFGIWTLGSRVGSPDIVRITGERKTVPDIVLQILSALEARGIVIDATEGTTTGFSDTENFVYDDDNDPLTADDGYDDVHYEEHLQIDEEEIDPFIEGSPQEEVDPPTRPGDDEEDEDKPKGDKDPKDDHSGDYGDWADNDPVEDIYRNARPLKGMLWNCRVTRPPDDIKNFLGPFVHDNDIDFVLLQESHPYRQALNDIKGYKLIMFYGWGDAGETAILAKESLRPRHQNAMRMRRGWFGSRVGREHDPRTFAGCRVGWLWVRSIHMPPGLDWSANGSLILNSRRAGAFKECAIRLAQDGRKRREEVELWGGDWNVSAGKNGQYSPGWMARQAGMKIVDNGGIDWLMGRHVKITNFRTGPSGGSDHDSRLFTIAPKLPKKEGKNEGDRDENDYPQQSGDVHHISVMSYNQYAGLGPSRIRIDMKKIRDTRSDIVCLQEAGSPRRNQIYRNQPGWSVYRNEGETPPMGGRRATTSTILWRTGLFSFEGGGTRLLAGEAGGRINRWAAWVKLVHRPSNTRLLVINVHLDTKAINHGFWTNNASHVANYRTSMDNLVQLMETHINYGAIFLAGDFNYNWRSVVKGGHKDVPGSPYRRLRALQTFCNWEVLGMGPTPTKGGWLDYVWLRKGPYSIRPVWQKVLRGYYSDHRPVIVTYRVKSR